jgi:hypothetical protein
VQKVDNGDTTCTYTKFASLIPSSRLPRIYTNLNFRVLPVYMNSKENYGNLNISPCKIYLKKILFNKKTQKEKTPKILHDIITLELSSSFNTSQNIIFQESSYKNRPRATPLSYYTLE